MQNRQAEIELAGKRVTVMGLGRFGGGIGVVQFLAKRGAGICVTDLKTENELAESLSQIENCENVTFRLGEHRESDFAEADLSLASCTGTDFADSRFLHTDLTEADFVGARNYAISPSLNVLKKTSFSLPEAVSLLYGLDIVLSE